MDWMVQEQEKVLPLPPAATTAYWKGTDSTLLTPRGTLTSRLKYSAPCVYWMVLLPFSVRKAALSLSLKQYGVRLTIPCSENKHVNKMDIMGADFYNVVQMMHDRLKCNALPIQLPIGSERGLQRDY